MRRATVSILALICMAGPGSRASFGQVRSRMIETVGIGLQDPSLINETQRRATAREAALAQAQAKMLSLLQVPPSGGTEEREKLKTGILEGAYVAKTEWAADGSCRVTLRRKKNPPP